MIKLKKSLVIFIFIVLIFGVMIFLLTSREQTRIQQPTSDNESMEIHAPTDVNVKKFSDARKQDVANIKNGTGVAKNTLKPLPYPRISMNYSMETMRSIGGHDADKNNTFILVKLDIRNYGYKYFDTYPNNFRIGRGGDINPIVNISTGKTIDAVIPNNSRAKGDLIFLIGQKINTGKLKYSPINKSANYYIIYKQLSPSDIEDIKAVEVVVNEEE